MDRPKRTCSPAESERCTKVAKISHESDNAVAETPLAQQHSNEVQVTVKLRSASKAAWHDPEPPGFWEELWARENAGGRPSTSSEDGRATSCPTAPPTPAPPGSSTVPGRPATSASVDDLHPTRDGPVVGYAERSSSGHSMTHSDDGPDDTGDGRPDADEDSHDSVEDFDDSDRSSHDEFAEWEWLEQIDGVASVELEHSQVAYCNAKLIRRAHMRSAFWVEMEEPSQETSDLAFELFDRYGRLNREYCDHEIRKGSGAWGRELDHGDILLFESISVERLWRH